MTPWTAPASQGPIRATVRLPGSKSLSARALHLAAIASGPSRLQGVLDSRDTRLFAAGLEALGAVLSPIGRDPLSVTPLDGEREGSASIDCGLAGTVMRFLPPLAALSAAPARFDGDEAARERPLAPLLAALEALGARISFEGAPGRLPFTIRGPLRVPECGWVEVDAGQSSQFLSALLLTAPLLGAPLEVRAPGRLVSAPHIEMTVAALVRRGCRIERIAAEPHSAWRVEPGRPAPLDEVIEPDLSNAGPFLAAAMVCGGEVRIPDWPEATTQAGDAWRPILTEMGARCEREGAELVLHGPEAGALTGIDIDMSGIGELAPSLAAICACARTPSRLRGIAHLRGHETDRLRALASGLRAAGARVVEHDDGLEIEPRPLKPAAHRAWGDHRMATFAAILGLRAPGTTLDDVGATSKTLPDFPGLWRACVSSGRSA